MQASNPVRKKLLIPLTAVTLLHQWSRLAWQVDLYFPALWKLACWEAASCSVPWFLYVLQPKCLVSLTGLDVLKSLEAAGVAYVWPKVMVIMGLLIPGSPGVIVNKCKLLPALWEAEAGRSLYLLLQAGQGSSGLQTKFQDSHGYMEKHWLEKKNHTVKVHAPQVYDWCSQSCISSKLSGGTNAPADPFVDISMTLR